VEWCEKLSESGVLDAAKNVMLVPDGRMLENVSAHMHVYICMYVYICICVLENVSARMHAHVCMSIYVHAGRARVGECECTYACICMYMYVCHCDLDFS
jgi:hypothetical protein